MLLILLPDYYLYRQLVCRRTQSVALRMAWWIPALVLSIYTIILFFTTNFIPENPRLLNLYLLVLGVFTLPKALLALSLWVGEWIGKKRQWRHHYALPVGVALGVLPAWPTVYGSFVGFQELEVNRVDCYFDDLPKGFDGYRIAVFSDAHVGSYTGADSLVLERAVDSLLAMKADAIFFLGDLQNIGPTASTPSSAITTTLPIRVGDSAASWPRRNRPSRPSANWDGGCCSTRTPCCATMATPSCSVAWKATRRKVPTMASASYTRPSRG